MTACFDRLQAQPQTEIDISQLTADERMVLKQIQINGTAGVTASESVGGFDGVYYLAGDERVAAKRFVAENRQELQAVDFSTRNPISTSVDRVVYDWILHFLGVREIEKYDTVVVERRPDETVWCLGRRSYEETPMRRYTESGSGSARIDGLALSEVYGEFEEIITESALAAHPAIHGDVREVLDAFRQSPEFDCVPTTVDGELAIEKCE